MDGSARLFGDRSPGVGQQESTANFLSYTVGLGLAILATIGSFVVSQTDLLWAPGIPVGLVVLGTGPKPWRHPIVALGAARRRPDGALERWGTLVRPATVAGSPLGTITPAG